MERWQWWILLGFWLVLGIDAGGEGRGGGGLEKVEVEAGGRNGLVLEGVAFRASMKVPCGATLPFFWKVSLSPHSPALVEGACTEEELQTEGGFCRAGPITVQRLGLAALSVSLSLLTSGFEQETRDENSSSSVSVEMVAEVFAIPAWLSVLPPFAAIGCAIATKEVLLSLLAGIWLGCVLVYRYLPHVAVLRMLDVYVVDALADRSHAQLLYFSLMLGGLVELVSRSGGAVAVGRFFASVSDDSRKAQLVVLAFGLSIFFDDYATLMVVGPTMLPLTDLLRVSREKLCMLVDSTAAPVASAVFASSWIGFQVGLIQSEFAHLQLSISPFSAFLSSGLYRFYDLTLIFLLALSIVSLRDFGPMYHIELSTRSGVSPHDLDSPNVESGSSPDDPLMPIEIISGHREITPLWWNAAVPFGVLIVAIVGGLLLDGMASARDAGVEELTLETVLGHADSFNVMLWAAFLASCSAMLLVVTQRLMTLPEALQCWIDGTKAIMGAVLALIHAWGISAICVDLQSSRWIVSLIGESLPHQIFPALVFALSAVISFSTGSSWGTMAMGFPVTIPLAVALRPADEPYLYLTIGASLTGAIFGDHCSPISDTTILAATSCGCSLIRHVQTQLPYALLVAVVTLFCGFLLAGFGLHFVLAHLCCFAAVAIFLYFFGKPVPLFHM